MIDLGIVHPGKTLRIPFSSFDKDDGSSVTMTNFAVGDILVYKDGNTTERASTAGYTATTDFDSKTGKHIAIIDLADNTTAGHFAAGSEYLVAIDAVTVDGVTTGGWVARFEIGYPEAILNTTIASLSSQTSFTLTAGPAENDALNGMWAVIHDVASAVQKAIVVITDYVGSTKTVTLGAGATFTVAATDNISVMGPAPLQAAAAALQSPGRTAVVDAAGLIDATTVKLGPTGTATGQTARDVGASVLVGDKTGFSLSAGGIQAIWDALTSALTTVGSIGKLLVDKLGGVSGQLASQTEVTSIQNNTRCVRVVPEVIERPDAGTTTYRIELLLYDAVGNMEAPDSAPTLDLVNQAGTDLSARLDSTTGTLVSTGRYRWIYTASSAHDLEQLVWAFSVVEGGATRVYGNTTLQVDTTAVDFTSSDRTKLEAIHGKLPSKNYLAGTSNADGDVQIDESTGDFNATQQARFLTAQQTRDAMKLAPTAGAPAAGSVDKHLDDIETAALAGQSASESVEAKLPTSDYLAGSANEDGSIAVDVGDIDLNVDVHPYSTSAPQRVIGTRITLFENESGFWVPMTSYNADRTALNLTGKQLQLIIEDNDGNVLATLEEGSGVLEVVSAAAGTWRFKATAEMCPAIAENKEANWWTLSDVTSGVSEVLAWGRVWVQRRAGH